jgi:hypothetical protein
VPFSVHPNRQWPPKHARSSPASAFIPS